MTDEERAWPELVDGEILLTDADERVWRQVHPLMVGANGRISSQTFVPGSQDGKKLSCTRESSVDAETAIEYYSSVLGRESAGAAAVTVGEVESESPIHDGAATLSALRAVDDSMVHSDSEVPPGHTYIDHRRIGSSRSSKKAKQLAYFATQRGLVGNTAAKQARSGNGGD